jgi:hypothetical protein
LGQAHKCGSVKLVNEISNCPLLTISSPIPIQEKTNNKTPVLPLKKTTYYHKVE